MNKVKELLKQALDLEDMDYRVEAKINDALNELEELIKPKTCEWKYNEFDEAWDGKCGVKFKIAFDTPKANNMKFCPQCGGKLIEIEPKDN